MESIHNNAEENEKFIEAKENKLSNYEEKNNDLQEYNYKIEGPDENDLENKEMEEKKQEIINKGKDEDINYEKKYEYNFNDLLIKDNNIINNEGNLFTQIHNNERNNTQNKDELIEKYDNNENEIINNIEIKELNDIDFNNNNYQEEELIQDYAINQNINNNLPEAEEEYIYNGNINYNDEDNEDDNQEFIVNENINYNYQEYNEPFINQGNIYYNEKDNDKIYNTDKKYDNKMNYEEEYINNGNIYGEEEYINNGNIYHNQLKNNKNSNKNNNIYQNKENTNNNKLLTKNDTVNNNDNSVNSLKEHILDLQNKLTLLEKENNQLKIEKENLIKNNNKNNIESINDLKKQNEYLNNTNKVLQEKNLQMSQELYKLKQISKINNIPNEENQINNNSRIELMKLKHKIDEDEVTISKLNLDKKMLESKIDNLEKKLQRQIKLIDNYKNKEKNSNQGIINDKKNIFKNNANSAHNVFKNIYYSKNDKNYRNNYNYNLGKSSGVQINETKNLLLKNEIEKLNNNLKSKDNIIQMIKEKIHYFYNEYNKQISALERNNNQSQLQIEQLFKERDELLGQNAELTMVINDLNDKINDAFYTFKRKRNEFNIIIQSYKDKIIEYKRKVILLKRKIDELYNIHNHLNNYIESGDNSDELKNKNKIINLNNNYSKSVRKDKKTPLIMDDDLNGSKMRPYENNRKLFTEY